MIFWVLYSAIMSRKSQAFNWHVTGTEFTSSNLTVLLGSATQFDGVGGYERTLARCYRAFSEY